MLYKIVDEDGNRFRNTEFLSFDGDQISQVNVYFGETYRNGAIVKGQ